MESTENTKRIKWIGYPSYLRGKFGKIKEELTGIMKDYVHVEFDDGQIATAHKTNDIEYVEERRDSRSQQLPKSRCG